LLVFCCDSIRLRALQRQSLPPHCFFPKGAPHLTQSLPPRFEGWDEVWQIVQHETMSTLLAATNELEKQLEANILAQESAPDDETSKNAAKESTKHALFALLKAVSPKDSLPPERRQEMDMFLMKHATVLKWSLLRSLSHAGHYRAFLGLSQTMEQIRRFLTAAKKSKLGEILVRDVDWSTTSLDTLNWVEQVLQFMTGDGRRKKDLGGFVLQDKGPIRAALKKVRR
jgi:hypothetical protein